MEKDRIHPAPVRGRVAAVVIGSIWILGLSGCGFHYKPTGADTSVEDAIIAETARAAGVLGFPVHAAITNDATKAQRDDGAVGWYQAGVAWFYRPNVEKFVVINEGETCPAGYCETARNVAAHEVCHYLSNQHDLLHWNCSNSVARATYARP